MAEWRGRLSDWCYAVFRIVVGLLFACHGAEKLFGAWTGHSELSDPLMAAAGGIEFFGGLLVALGVGTGPAAFLASGEMAVAYFRVHARRGFWPIRNGGELAVLYCFAFLFIAFRGAGPIGLGRSRR